MTDQAMPRLREALTARRGYPVSKPSMTMATGGSFPEYPVWESNPIGAYVRFEDAWDLVEAALSGSRAMPEGLRALSNAATPGPWHSEGDEYGADIYGPDRDRHFVAVDHEGLAPAVRSGADADFIVACVAYVRARLSSETPRE